MQQLFRFYKTPENKCYIALPEWTGPISSMYRKVLILSGFMLLLASIRSFSQQSFPVQETKQQPADSFVIASYQVLDTGVFQNYHYTVTFRHTTHPTLYLRKIYQDSTLTTLMGQLFCVNDVPNGPYEFYLVGGLTSRGRMNMGEEEGEKNILNAQGILIQKGFYKSGIKTGTWEYYNASGVLYQKKIFDARGNLQKTITVGVTD